MDRQMPLVSIIVPVYNVENYLKECIDSILMQTYKNIEVILINDGSSDSSGKLCDEYKEKDIRIKVVHKTNGGLSDARNSGLDICKGEYISFVDSDDYISPIFVEIYMQAIQEGNCDIVAMKGGTDFWDGDVFKPVLASRRDECRMEYLEAKVVLEKMLYQQIATGAPFKFCKKKLFDKIRFPYGYLYEDVATTYKLFLEASNSAIIYGDLYAYRKRRDSIIRQKFNEKKLIALSIFDQLVQDENLNELGLNKAACSRVYAMLYSVFLQIPHGNEKEKKRIWKKLKTVQKTVMSDTSKYIRKKNKCASWISLLGMHCSYQIGRKFGQKGAMN